MSIQQFGPAFSREKLFKAREVAREIAFELASKITPGMKEEHAHALYKELCNKYGVEKNWHPAKLRFGSNTLKNFKDVSEDVTLQENDLFFVDIGPVVDGHEADYGQTFTIGSDFNHKHIALTAEKIFFEVLEHWKETKSTGHELYKFAESRTQHFGYTLNMGNDGHRIGDFPHHIIFKGGLAECEELIVPDAWILEIHLWNKEKTFGAFFEDILSTDLV